MNKLIILNHKMNMEYDEVFKYIDRLNQIETNNDIIVAPSNIYLSDFINHCTWGVGAQNVHYKESGNYTGEVSTLQLKSMGIEYSLIGHYERKKYFNETNKDINLKLNACLDSNIAPILCFGETGLEEDIISSLDEILKGITNINFIIFAYEPLKVNDDSIEDISEKIDIIYNYLYDKYNTVPNLIYGGGILKKDVKDLLSNDKINGILIGKVSTNIEKVEDLIKSIN